jgi:hypothetical protein
MAAKKVKNKLYETRLFGNTLIWIEKSKLKGSAGMANDNQFSDFINEVSLQTKIENIWSNTCGSWGNCNEATIQSFLSQCDEYNLDPQYCMGWVEQHKEQIPNWNLVSEASLGWIAQHSSTGSPYTASDDSLN